MGRPVADASKLRARQNELAKEFGGEAEKNWWDPCKNGDGTGQPLGLRGVAQRLEDAAAGGEMFCPRFAGGQEPLLARWELVVHKWFTQFLHHTALGLHIAPSDQGQPELLSDPSDFVIFAGVWMFAQQIYLLHDLDGRDTQAFDEVFKACLLEGFEQYGVSSDLIVTAPKAKPTAEDESA